MKRIKPINVKSMGDYQLLIEFNSGEKKVFDCKPYINGDWFSELQNKDYFNSVRVSGNTIEWTHGQDICPDCLYDNSILLKS